VTDTPEEADVTAALARIALYHYTECVLALSKKNYALALVHHTAAVVLVDIATEILGEKAKPREEPKCNSPTSI